jgi:hypothetical protein
MRTWVSRAIAAAAVIVLVAFALTATRTAGQTASGQSARPARIEGKPNINGIWQVMNTANWDLLAHDVKPAVAQRGVYANHPVLAAPVVALGTVGIVPPGPGVVEGNEIPYKPEAAAKKQENAEHWLDRDPEVRCYMPGVPRAMYMPYPFQITQSGSKIQMVFAYANASRTINLQDAPKPPADKWMGHSVGRWEGNTLVTHVTNFNDRTWFSRAGDFHSDALDLVERFTPITPDALKYEVTVTDPNVFTRPWKMSMVLYRQLEDNPTLMEFRCIELVEETFLGHLRKNQLVKHWEGDTIVIDVTRRVPEGDKRYER